MKAKRVLENINFTRGNIPKAGLELGSGRLKKWWDSIKYQPKKSDLITQKMGEVLKKRGHSVAMNASGNAFFIYTMGPRKGAITANFHTDSDEKIWMDTEYPDDDSGISDDDYGFDQDIVGKFSDPDDLIKRVERVIEEKTPIIERTINRREILEYMRKYEAALEDLETLGILSDDIKSQLEKHRKNIMIKEFGKDNAS